MKYSLIIIAAVIAMASCTKTKTNTVTVTKNDTVTVRDTFAVQANLIGTWNSSTGASPITFTATTYQVQTLAAVAYLASPDTIYNISPTNVVSPKFAYSLSTNNDTLYLTGIAPVFSAMAMYIKS